MSSTAWKGRLVFGAHSIAVKFLTGAREEHVAFNLLHKCGSRITQQKRCVSEDVPVKEADLGKGVEISKGVYVAVTKDEIAAVSPDASDTLELTKFLDAGSIDPVFFASSYFVHPATIEDEALYAVLESQLAESEMLGFGRLMIGGRERFLVLRSSYAGSGIVAHALFYREEARQLGRFRTNVSVSTGVARIKLPRGVLRIDELVDRQSDALRKLIASKSGSGPKSPAAAKKASKNTNRTELQKHPSTKAA